MAPGQKTLAQDYEVETPALFQAWTNRGLPASGLVAAERIRQHHTSPGIRYSLVGIPWNSPQSGLRNSRYPRNRGL